MPRKWTIALALLASIVAFGTIASAQEKGQIGLNLGYPTVGLTWHVSESVAVRPEFTFSFGSSSTTSGSGMEGSDADSWGVGFGLSALFYVADWDGVKGYVAPRFAMTHSNTEAISTVSSSRSENDGNSYLLGLRLGGQYSLNRRVAVFGEAGIDYTTSHSEIGGTLTSSRLENDNWLLSPRTAVGLILYF